MEPMYDFLNTLQRILNIVQLLIPLYRNNVWVSNCIVTTYGEQQIMVAIATNR
jgi:hypothetical protein